MQPTREEYIALRKQGLSPEQIQQQASKPKQTFMQSAGGIADAVFGGGKVGEWIGTEAARGTFGKGVQRFTTGQEMTKEDESNVSDGPTGGQIVGSALRSASLFTPVGKIASMATPTLGRVGANVLGGAVAGYASDVGRNLEERENALAPGLGTALGGGIPLVQAGIRGVGAILQGTGNKIISSNIKPSKVDWEDGFDLKNLEKYGVKGTLQEMLDSAQTQISTRMNQLRQVVAQSPESVDLNGVINKTAEQLTTGRISGFGSNKQIQNALTNLKDEVAIVAPKGQSSLADAQSIKQAAGQFGAWKWNIPDAEAKAQERVFNTFYNVMKKELEGKGGTAVSELNKQMSELIPIANALIRRVPVAARNQALSLSDMLVLTGATFNPSANLLALINIAQRSAATGSALRDAGNGLRRFGVQATREGEALGRGLLNTINSPQNPGSQGIGQ